LCGGHCLRSIDKLDELIVEARVGAPRRFLRPHVGQLLCGRIDAECNGEND
jgi:hypothetical protein